MNIFYLDKDPTKCAQYHCDKHVVKMILESAQLLCTAQRELGNDNVPYKSTHVNHPCAIWVRESAENYSWLFRLFIELGREYSHRYGGKIHKSISVCFPHVRRLPPRIARVDGTRPAQAMPDEYRCIDPVRAYRNYYIGEKMELLSYTNRDWPVWIADHHIEAYKEAFKNA